MSRREIKRGINVSITLDQILALVGRLDDTQGEETSRERFRRFLKENVLEIGRIRDYVEECLRKSGDQYSRALQDLVNHIGGFLGFKVDFGRYHGVSGEIGFDGLWVSKDFHIVVEVKTTEAYAIKTSTLMDYINRLISEKKIPNWDHAMGLYVVGRVDPEIRQLENAVIAEKRGDQLRIISLESLLTLAQMMNEYDVAHEDILAVLRPSGPKIDPVIDLMARLVSEEEEEELRGKEPSSQEPPTEGEASYWLTPVKSDETCTAEEEIRILVGQERIYAFGDRTPGRKHLKPGDWICFYASGKGIIAHAKVSSPPLRKPNPRVHHSEKYPWTFSLESSALYIDQPVIIDATLRTQLDYYKGRDPNKSWGWFVVGTRQIAKHDFEILTRQQSKK
jgi:hypothetical protein